MYNSEISAVPDPIVGGCGAFVDVVCGCRSSLVVKAAVNTGGGLEIWVRRKTLSDKTVSPKAIFNCTFFVCASLRSHPLIKGKNERRQLEKQENKSCERSPCGAIDRVKQRTSQVLTTTTDFEELGPPSPQPVDHHQHLLGPADFYKHCDKVLLPPKQNHGNTIGKAGTWR